ncbi:hypothetical protein BP6252_09404 [Coleophoma cylindrospora]|uniref:Zn(2)-C6 fungal-type domain-containing protein n=1 Tax=Coleophoma cylindrospora TaxID=1849047 RepID=A0A3D8R225_9HELO|nr:hypothetical protein BP6252_09404 [Coleophoma cylindrospora]
MDGPPQLKRKRVVTACTECHRRKQKCDHAKPCSNCVARNVREKCIYDDGEPLGWSSLEQPEQASPDFTSQAGYSLSSSTNTYIDLQTSLLPQTPLKQSPPLRNAGTLDKFREVLGLLPSKQITKELVSNYFVEANWYFLVLETFYFNQLHETWSESKNKGLNHMPLQMQHFTPLLCQVLAVSLQFLPLDRPCAEALRLENLEAADQLSYRYSAAGAELMSALGRHQSSVVAVQHDLMRSLWLKNRSRGTESWYALGDAIKQAQDLGLHLQSCIPQSESIDLEKTLSNLWYDEYKRRLWITLFVWDSHMAFVLGRPRAINILDCTVRTPLDCNIPEQPSKIIPTPAHASEVPSTYSAHLFHYFLAQKIHEILSKGANKPHFADYNFILSLHDQVITELHNLPAAVRPENPDTSLDLRYPRLLKQRQHITNAAQSFLIALHRPHTKQHETSRKAATDAAFSCLRAQQGLFDLVKEHQYRIYNLSFYTIDAGMFLAAMVLEQKTIERAFLENIYMALSKAMTRLSLMQHRSAMARSGLQLLSGCCQKICLVHGLDHSTLTSESSSYSNHSSATMSPFSLDPSVPRNVLQNPDTEHMVEGTVSHPGTAVLDRHLDPSLISSSIPLVTPFEFSFDTAPYLNAFSDLDPAESISDTMWKDLLG